MRALCDVSVKLIDYESLKTGLKVLPLLTCDAPAYTRDSTVRPLLSCWVNISKRRSNLYLIIRSGYIVFTVYVEFVWIR